MADAGDVHPMGVAATPRGASRVGVSRVGVSRVGAEDRLDQGVQRVRKVSRVSQDHREIRVSQVPKGRPVPLNLLIQSF